MLKGRAYNPYDAIALAIYARGDDFYHKHEKLLHALRAAEAELKQAAWEYINAMA
ncbi:MAG: hypothetical protein IJ184_01080 [Alphaproteobacteria bacterium]|nr:hypothetical protein [Alphaproteobacteria bacterium]